MGLLPYRSHIIFAVLKLITIKKVFMKKGKYIDNNIIMVCLASKRRAMQQQPDTHQQLAETIAVRKRLFEAYNSSFGTAPEGTMQQLQVTNYAYGFNYQQPVSENYIKNTPQAA
jgi:hypothetical protein